VREVLLLAGDDNDLSQVLKYGYASDGVREQLLKLDIKTLKPVKHMSLSRYQCVPVSAVFLHIGQSIDLLPFSLSNGVCQRACERFFSVSV